MDQFVVSVFNGTRFVIENIVFYLFFLLIKFSRLKEARDQDLAHSLGTAKNIFVKFVRQVIICNFCGAWYDSFTVTSIHNIQRSRRNNSQKPRNNLASRLHKIQGLKLKEAELIGKTVWRKRKEKILKRRD